MDGMFVKRAISQLLIGPLPANTQNPAHLKGLAWNGKPLNNNNPQSNEKSDLLGVRIKTTAMNL